jgi:hypothetical protein
MGIRLVVSSSTVQNAIRHVFNQNEYTYPSDWFTEQVEQCFRCKVVSFSSTGHSTYIEFENDHDATAFILRWS